MSFPVAPDFGDLQSLADFMSRASDPAHTASVAAELAALEGPIVADASAGSIEELKALMDSAAGGPKASVDAGKAPLPVNVAILPEKVEAGDMNEDLVKKAIVDFGHLGDISSIADLYIAMSNVAKRTARGHPEEYRITDPKEAAQIFADMADSAFNVMLGPPLAGMYSFVSGTTSTFSRRMSKTEVHLSFLAELFKGFSLTDVAVKQLDGILTNFVKSLTDISVSTDRTNKTVNQTIRLHQTIATNISGSAEKPIWIYQPRTRIVYMRIDNSTWKWSTNKANHEESDFNMQYVVADIDLNVNRWLAAKPQLEAIFQKVTGATFKQYGKMRFPPPIDPAAK